MLPDNYGKRMHTSIRGKLYRNESARIPAMTLKPTRNAAGMAYTGSRSGRLLREDAARLSLYGTLDPLAAYRFDVVRLPCPCCGSNQKGKVALKPGPSGARRRLRQLREKYSRQQG